MNLVENEIISSCSWSCSITSYFWTSRAAQHCWGGLQYLAKWCCALHTHTHTYEICWCGWCELQIQKQSCFSSYSVWLETFLSCCFAPIHKKSPFSKKNSILSDASCCQRANSLLSTFPSKSNWILGRELPFPLETFSFQPERLSGICFKLLCNACCWWQCKSFPTLWEESWLNRKASYIKEILTTYMSYSN